VEQEEVTLKFEMLECDTCGKTRRCRNNWNQQTQPVEYAEFLKACRGWIEGRFIQHGADDKPHVFAGTWCSFACAQEKFAIENFVPYSGS